MTAEENLPKIGYLYHFPDLNHPTDRFRLEIHVSDTPTHKHFDVNRIIFPIFHDNEVIEISVHHPWSAEKEYHVCPGWVIMVDRSGKKKEAFTLGGRLVLKDQGEQTICTLSSEAPIFGVNEASMLSKLLVDGIEVIFAEQRAAFHDARKFKDQLCQTKPFTLYLACLKELIRKVEGVQNKDELTFDYMMFLHTQWHRLEAVGKLPVLLPSLDELFDPEG